MPPLDALRAHREAVVHEHMESENRLDLDATLATFAHPRYELIATGQVYDGEDEVRAYFASSRATFPDQRNELVALHHVDDAVIVEFDLLGTQRGELMGFPPTDKPFRCRMAAIYLFEGEGLVCERVYFDALTILGQLGHLPS
ncbi:MAG TPA: ester cyclase [Acidimicrobiales bacterium]|nr:ester cyclase [Acidimicrobiales bacterium]